jgi:hypothetical protein
MTFSSYLQDISSQPLQRTKIIIEINFEMKYISVKGHNMITLITVK